MLVIDASIAVGIALVGTRPAVLEAEDLIGPPLMWSEAASALHELGFRGDLGHDAVRTAIARLDELGIAKRDPVRLRVEAHDIAQQLGWAKTYDAEYLALARLEGAPLLTRDGRLQRGAGHVVHIIGPAELDPGR
jgi:predicted nucleic acid-binding protein